MSSSPDARPLTFSLNGRSVNVRAEPSETLLEVVRDRLGLTGTKSVCTMGNCGSCTVRLDGRAVYSCLTLAAECVDADVVTIEGLADGDELHPVQQAFIDRDAFQCGYCTPGQIMSLATLLDAQRDAPIEEADIVRAVSGNLCRCGAYRHILEAGRQAAGLEPTSSRPAASARARLVDATVPETSR